MLNPLPDLSCRRKLVNSEDGRRGIRSAGVLFVAGSSISGRIRERVASYICHLRGMLDVAGRGSEKRSLVGPCRDVDLPLIKACERKRENLVDDR